MRKLKQLMLGVMVFVLLIPIGGLALITFSPQTLLTLAERFSPYVVTAEHIEVKVLTPTLILENVVVSNAQEKVVARVTSIDLAGHWGSIFSEQPQLSGSISDGTVDLNNISAVDDAPKNDSANTSASTMDINGILQQVNVSVSHLDLHLATGELIQIKQLARLTDLTDQQQGLSFSIAYNKDAVVLPVEGRLLSSVENGVPTVNVSVPSLDLRTLLAVSEESTASANSDVDELVNEAPIDWSWVSPLAPLSVALESDQIQLPQGQVNHLNAVFALDNTGPVATIRQHYRADVALAINDDYHINDRLEFESDWNILGKSTTGADVKGTTAIRIGSHAVDVTGALNLNGVVGHAVTLKSSFDTFPVKAVSKKAVQLQAQSQALFPFSISTTLATLDKHIALSELELKAGGSDINGSLDIYLQNVLSGLKDAQFSLQSKQLILPKSKEKSVVKNKAKKELLFSPDVIDLAWLDTLSMKGQWDIDTLLYDDRILLEGSMNTLAIANKTLALNTTVENIAQGTLQANIALSNVGEAMTLVTSGSVKGLLLESLALLPKDEFTGGKTNIDFTLQSKGNSTQALASQLQGDFLLVAKEGTIANNSFELIGSDLLLNLINSINPFHKKSKNTALECAVVKTKIENGVLNFKDSIAIKTSKMIVVADGKVDLNTEKLNLGINPKARKGVGVDVASLAKFVAVQGTLAKPAMGVSAGGTLKSIASIGAAISTGGLSLVASSLVDKATSGDACKRAASAFSQ